MPFEVCVYKMCEYIYSDICSAISSHPFNGLIYQATFLLLVTLLTLFHTLFTLFIPF